MQIQAINNSNTNINFGIKVKTADVLEATSMRIIYNDGIEGLKNIVKTFDTNTTKKNVGWRGYKYYAQNIGQRITEKYPEIAKATEEIKEILQKNPEINKKDLSKAVNPIIEKLGDTIDITL
jgi:hypothetical protein